MVEEWKPIPGYYGFYEASNLGRIRSVDGKPTVNPKMLNYIWKSKVLKQKTIKHKNRVDYRITLWKNGVRQDALVSRLIAMAWIGMPGGNMTVNHINGDSKDNRAVNLEWVSLAENIRHGFSTGLYSKICHRVLLTDETGNTFDFLSMCSANKFLGRNRNYIQDRINRGINQMISFTGDIYYAMPQE